MTPTECPVEGCYIESAHSHATDTRACPTCHYPLGNGTLREENLKLRQALDVAKEALIKLDDLELSFSGSHGLMWPPDSKKTYFEGKINVAKDALSQIFSILGEEK